MLLTNLVEAHVKKNICQFQDAQTIPNTAEPLDPQGVMKLFELHASTRSEKGLPFPNHLQLHNIPEVYSTVMHCTGATL